MNRSRLLFTAKLLASIGIGLALYLFVNYLTQPAYRLCTISAKVNCDAVISGEVSQTLGIPTALYGLVGYTVILVAAFLGKKKLMLGTAIFGVLFCIRLIYIEIFRIGVICPVCILCFIDMVSLLTVSYLLVKKKGSVTPPVENV